MKVFLILSRLTNILKEFLVSKETVVLHRWEGSKQKFGFVGRVDGGWVAAVGGLEG